MYRQVITQTKDTKNKIYSLHEPHVYCVAKGKDYKPYEYGSKASVVTTAKEGIILSAVSHSNPIHDSHTLNEVLSKAQEVRSTKILKAVCDHGYQGVKAVDETLILLPKAVLKRDNRYQRDKKRQQCRRRAGIEPLIGHLKSDFRLSKNILKGAVDDAINLYMAACAWNLRKWMKKASSRFFYALDFSVSGSDSSIALYTIFAEFFVSN